MKNCHTAYAAHTSVLSQPFRCEKRRTLTSYKTILPEVSHHSVHRGEILSYMDCMRYPEAPYHPMLRDLIINDHPVSRLQRPHIIMYPQAPHHPVSIGLTPFCVQRPHITLCFQTSHRAQRAENMMASTVITLGLNKGLLLSEVSLYFIAT